jgi:ParB family chromosome partitioning protein
MKRRIRSRDISSSYDELLSSPGPNRISIGFEEKIKEYFQIDIDSINPYKNQARKIFNEEEIKKLSDTIKLHGIRQPLTVIKSSEVGQYEVISGERRLRAAKLAGLNKVPCIVLQSDDNIDEIALIENIQREDLHPIELSNCYHSLLQNYKYGDITALSKRIGVSKPHLVEVLSYHKLPEEIKIYLLNHEIGSRAILRRLMACTDIQEMKKILGMGELHPQKVKQKSLLKISLLGGDIKIETGKWKLSEGEKQALKKRLLKYIETL